MYTIFDLPIHVTNSIPSSSTRPSCASLNNALLDEATLSASANTFTRIAGTAIEGNGKKDAGGGLGGAGILDWRTNVHSVWIIAFIVMVWV
jgi:hypothetical protein